MKKANSLSKIKLDQQHKRKFIISNILQPGYNKQFHQNRTKQSAQNRISKLNICSSKSLANFKSVQLNNQSNSKLKFQQEKIAEDKFDKIQQLILRAKQITQIQENKVKIGKAKKFKINGKKNAITFLTGLQIFQVQQKKKKVDVIQNQTPSLQTDQYLRNLLNPQYDDLEQLRRMIKQTNKNLKCYKKQTLSIKKEVLKAGQMINKNGYSLADLNYKKINTIDIQREHQKPQKEFTKNKQLSENNQIRVFKNHLPYN